MQIANSITELVGRTPLLDLQNYASTLHLSGRILAKLEYFNPGGSVKDRVALAMIEAAGIRRGDTIIEPTSGNTGIGLAMVAASRGIKLILTMPESMSVERRKILAAYGAEIVLTPASEGMRGAIERAERLRESIPGSTILGQFSNPANPEIHATTTAPEILEDTDGGFDIFVAGVGTGGTISGVGRVLKDYNADIKVVAVEPADSPLLSGGLAGGHKLQGIGANFVPANFDGSVVDSIMQITTDEAFAACHTLARTEGVLVGISSGAALAAATKLAARSSVRIVVLLPDTGERYISTELFDM